MKTPVNSTFRRTLIITVVFLIAVFSFRYVIAQTTGEEHSAAKEAVAEPANHEVEKFNAGEMIFEHILDAHDWHIMGEGHSAVSIPLPVIIYSKDRGVDVFLSNKFHHGETAHNGYMLYKKHGANKYTIVAVNEMEDVPSSSATINEQISANLFDLSFTKNVASIFISGFLLLLIFSAVAKGYKTNRDQAPKGIQSLMEPLVVLIRDDVAKASIGPKYEKFVPYLLTVFFFILINNLLGLVPIFPGGSNLTGNISITLTLAVLTFIIQMANTNGNFWHHVFAMPGVPKPVLIILTPIEILQVFLKPFVLMVRLFANITAGHIVALAFVSLIFIFAQMFGNVAGYGISIMSGIFYVFMGFLEMLVGFLQAYVFTLLTAIYFGEAMAESHHKEAH